MMKRITLCEGSLLDTLRGSASAGQSRTFHAWCHIVCTHFSSQGNNSLCIKLVVDMTSCGEHMRDHRQLC
jgi:hypothetical protein